MRLFDRLAIPITGAVAFIALAGCSGGVPGPGHTPPGPPSTERPDEDVLEFPLPAIDPREHFTVQIPEKLQETIEGRGDLLVSALHVEGQDFGDSGPCAVELTVDYAHGNRDARRLAEPVPTSAEAREATERHIERFLESYSVRSTDEFDEKYKSGTPVSGTGHDEALQEYWDEGVYDTWADVREAYFAEFTAYYEGEAKEAARYSDIENVARSLGFPSAQPLTELEGSAPDRDVYISDDYGTLILVQECTALPSNSDENYPAFESQTIAFPFDEDGEEGTSRLAEIDVTVTHGGKVALLGGKVNGWIRETSGEWRSGRG